MQVARSEVELEVLVARIDRRELDVLGRDSGGPQPAGGWDQARQQRLIDTILRNWSIPPIYVEEGGPAGREMVLDGCQRLHTIARFFHDELSCSGAIPPADDDVARLDRLRFGDLPADVRRRVRRFRLTVVTLTEHDPDELDELLGRLETPAQVDSHPVGTDPHQPPSRHSPVGYRWLFAERPPERVPAPRSGDTPGHTPTATGTHRAHLSPEPIYDEVSAWFVDLSEFQDLSSVEPASAPRWSSPADTGDAAARAAVHPDGGGVTAAGLPQREPLAQLVPGAIDPPRDAAPGNGPATDPDEVAERLASYQQGVAEGRQDRDGPGLADDAGQEPTSPSVFDDHHPTG